MKKTLILKTFTTLTMLTLAISACSTSKSAQKDSSGEYYSGMSIEQLIENTDLDAEPATTDEPVISLNRKGHKVPKVVNDAVKKWIVYFTKTNPSWFQRALTRSEEFETNMKNILISNDVPEELFYLALIESAFVQKARSHAGAKGIWQFMKGTGRLYGLRVDRSVDERVDPYKATAAAASYLKDLYNIYGSWYLAIASYNAGEGRIRSAILRHRERDFWALADKNALPDETMNYVPKYIAAVIVAENYEKFGFTYNGPSKEGIIVDEDIKTLFAVDQFKRGSTPSRRKSDSSAYASYSPRPEETITRTHKVRRGDNLSSISRKYGVSISQLKDCNRRLRNTNNIVIGQVLDLNCAESSGPVKTVASAETATGSETNIASTETTETPKRKEKPIIYRVRSGDTLERISKKYDVTIEQIKDCNPTVKRYTILAGQKLKITCTKDAVESNYIVHTVRRGDTLWSISSRYGVSINDIMKWNNLRKKSVIFKGRKLKIYKNS